LARLRLHRVAILGLLAGGYVADAQPTGDDEGYVYGERLGVAHGLGMPTHPGSAAWLVAVGESAELVALNELSGYDDEHGNGDGSTKASG
jgi:hypothetical protein